MKRTLTALLTTAVFAGAVMLAPNTKQSTTSLPIVHAQSGCSVTSLTGNYGVRWQGFDILKGTAHEVPWAGVGVLTFDGAGNVSFSWTQSLDGKISTGLSGAGTYSVNSDCTGSVSFTSGDAAGETANIAIVAGGREVFAISTLASQTLVIDAKQQ
jgi:hypothetical protein